MSKRQWRVFLAKYRLRISGCTLLFAYTLFSSPAILSQPITVRPPANPTAARWTDLLLEATNSSPSQRSRSSRRNFSGQNLIGVKAAGREMTHFDFRNAQLIGADFRRADLRGADFRGADLTNAILTSAKLTTAKFDRHTRLPLSREAALRLGMIEADSQEAASPSSMSPED